MNINEMGFVERYVCLDSVESTNSYAKSLGEFSTGGLTVIRAKRQTGGRGRGVNSFFSDHDGGLWVSVITPISDISAHFKYNRAISLAILESLRELCANADIKIKWPNDIYWNDKKITGVLLENILGKPELIIVGFGVNVNISADEFPENIRGKSTSVLMETGREAEVESLLGGILKRYQQSINDGDEAAAHRLYTGSLYKKDRPAAVNDVCGVFISVDPDGRLRLETEQGHKLFSSGTLRFIDEAPCLSRRKAHCVPPPENRTESGDVCGRQYATFNWYFNTSDNNNNGSVYNG